MSGEHDNGEPCTNCSGCEHHVKDDVGLWMCEKWGACHYPCEDFKRHEKSGQEG